MGSAADPNSYRGMKNAPCLVRYWSAFHCRFGAICVAEQPPIARGGAHAHAHGWRQDESGGALCFFFAIPTALRPKGADSAASPSVTDGANQTWNNVIS